MDPRHAGPIPDRFSAPEWFATVDAGAIAIAVAQSVPNDGTPEEYAAAAIRAALPRIIAMFDRTWYPTQDAYDGAARALRDRTAYIEEIGHRAGYDAWRARRRANGTYGTYTT